MTKPPIVPRTALEQVIKDLREPDHASSATEAALRAIERTDVGALEISAMKAVAQLDRQNRIYRDLFISPIDNAWKLIEERQRQLQRMLGSSGSDTMKAIERAEAAFNSFRNLAAHIPSFDADVRSFVSTLSESDDGQIDLPAVAVGSVIVPEKPVQEGLLIKCTSFVWSSIVRKLKDDWSQAFKIPPRVWEEIIAGAFHAAGFNEVILTPRSGDHGRDVIAVRQGIGSVRVLGSVKAYKPGHLITKEEVHALMGVVSIDPNASKGLFATTSDFAPRIRDDPRLAAAEPHRIELMNGKRLQEWLKSLAPED